MFGRKKMYKKGLADALKANEAFARKQEAAIAYMREEVRNGNKKLEDALNDAVSSLEGNIDGLYNFLNSKEKAALYHLSTPTDVKDIEDSEKRLLLAVLYQLAFEEGDGVTEAQQDYIRALQKYLGITNPQTEADLSVVGDIDSLDVQKVFLQAVLEFFYLQSGTEITDSQEEFLSYFSVNARQAELIEMRVSRLFNAMGAEGVAEKYGYVPKEDPVCETANISLRSDDPTEALSIAEQLYFTGRGKDAIPILNELADLNVGRAFYILGMIYFSGDIDFSPNAEKANRYWSKGSKQGDILCKDRCWINGIDDGSGSNRNKTWEDLGDALEKLADSGDLLAQFQLAIHFLNNKPNYERSVDLLEPLAQKGFFQAEYSFGIRTQDGQGIPADLDEANRWYQKAFEHGHFGAGYQLLTNLVFYENDTSERTIELAKKLVSGDRFKYELRILKQALNELPGFGYAAGYKLSVSLWNARRNHDESFRSRSSAVSVIEQDIQAAVDYANSILSTGCETVQQLKGQYNNYLNFQCQKMLLFALGKLKNTSSVETLIENYKQQMNARLERAINEHIGNLRLYASEASIDYDNFIFNFGETSASGNSFFARLNAEYSIVGTTITPVSDLLDRKLRAFSEAVRQDVGQIFNELGQEYSKLLSAAE